MISYSETNETFIEIFSNIDLLLREILSDNDLSFNTARARFLYISEQMGFDKDFIKIGSLVFNIYYKILVNKHIVDKTEIYLANFVFQELYNTFNDNKIKLITPEQEEIVKAYIQKISIDNTNKLEELDCYFNEIKESKSKYGLPLFEILATDNNGELIKIYLWKEYETAQFHRNFEVIKNMFATGRKIRFFNLSFSNKGYYFQNERTSFVIEPDLLLDISMVAECFLKDSIVPELYFLKFLQKPDFNLHILKGGFVNYLLDKVMSMRFENGTRTQKLTQIGERWGLKQDFESLLKNQFLKILDYTEKDLTDIIDDINKHHLKNLLFVADFYKDKKITTEPSFISEKYGLQGRLDALIEDDMKMSYKLQDTSYKRSGNLRLPYPVAAEFTSVPPKNLRSGNLRLPHSVAAEFTSVPPKNENKTIFELKSGKAPNYSYWQNHYAQVMGYNLLLKSVYGEDRRGHSSILYSKADSNPLRNITPSDAVYSQILMCRNIIVSYLLRVSTAEISLPLPANDTLLPSYLVSEIQEFRNIFSGLEGYEKAYLNYMTAFIIKEMIAQKTGYIDTSGLVRAGFSSLWSLSFLEKIKQKIIYRMKMDNGEWKMENESVAAELTSVPFSSITKNTKHKYFTFTYDGDNDIGVFREGDLLIFYPAIYENGSYHADPLKVPLLKAVLKKIETNSITVSFRNESLTIDYLNNYEYFYAEKDILESSFTTSIASMIQFFKKDKIKRDMFFGLKEPRFDSCHKSLSPNSCEEQGGDIRHRIISKSTTFKDYLLIQGPPGTGKTSIYLISIIKQHLIKKDTPVIVLAFTNRAVEEICLKLSENELNFILLGTNHSEADYHISSIIQKFDLNIDTISEDFNKIKTILTNNKIYVSTVASYQNEGSFLNKYIKTDLLIIDEASQLLESQLIGIIADFERFILIGDHYQLPAVSTQNITNLPAELTETIGLNSLQESLFERLYNRCLEKGWHEAIELLPEHYRMHHEIADLINHYYDHKLKAVSQRQFAELSLYSGKMDNVENGFIPSDKNEPITASLFIHRTIFIPTKEINNKKYNPEEAHKIKTIIETIYKYLNHDFNENTIGIICAWRLQVNHVTSILTDLPYSKMITVDTVERFQGSEKDIIIYSTSVSSPKILKNLQSLTKNNKVDRKLNVAISRAKEQFILLGNKEILSCSPHYKNIISKCYL